MPNGLIDFAAFAQPRRALRPVPQTSPRRRLLSRPCAPLVGWWCQPSAHTPSRFIAKVVIVGVCLHEEIVDPSELRRRALVLGHLLDFVAVSELG
jgi:hypothetical protein